MPIRRGRRAPDGDYAARHRFGRRIRQICVRDPAGRRRRRLVAPRSGARARPRRRPPGVARCGSLRRPVLVGGISFGAHLAAEWAVRNPSRCAGLVLALPGLARRAGDGAGVAVGVGCRPPGAVPWGSAARWPRDRRSAAWLARSWHGRGAATATGAGRVAGGGRRAGRRRRWLSWPAGGPRRASPPASTTRSTRFGGGHVGGRDASGGRVHDAAGHRRCGPGVTGSSSGTGVAPGRRPPRQLATQGRLPGPARSPPAARWAAGSAPAPAGCRRNPAAQA